MVEAFGKKETDPMNGKTYWSEEEALLAEEKVIQEAKEAAIMKRDAKREAETKVAEAKYDNVLSKAFGAHHIRVMKKATADAHTEAKKAHEVKKATADAHTEALKYAHESKKVTADAHTEAKKAHESKKATADAHTEALKYAHESKKATADAHTEAKKAHEVKKATADA